jgi:hypothetical protein
MRPKLPYILIFATSVFALLTFSAMAQSGSVSCNTRFGVVHLDQRLPGGNISGMTKHQSDWYKKTGTKRFASVCEDETKPDYLILWTSEDASSVVGSTVGGNGSVVTVRRDRVRFYIVAVDKRDLQAALYSGEHEYSALHWADQSSLEDAVKFLAARHAKK